MKTSTFVSFCLLFVAGLLSLHALMRESFSPARGFEARLARTREERDEANLRALLLASELADYQQSIATLLPSAIHGEEATRAYPLRQLASLAAKGTGGYEIERASSLFEGAKTAFREHDFEQATKLFSNLLEKHPLSAHVPEARFLLAESEFQRKDYAASSAAIEDMIETYPENELTGFALLRLGRIFELQSRGEDAGDIYRSILANFKQPELVRQAQENLKAVDL